MIETARVKCAHCGIVVEDDEYCGPYCINCGYVACWMPAVSKEGEENGTHT